MTRRSRTGFHTGNPDPEQLYYLGWLSADEWINAVDGNIGNNSTGDMLGFAGSFASFQALHPGALTQYIGAYGVDAAGDSVWAVLNHNSEFTVIPEPTTGALILLGGLCFLKRRRERDR